MVDVKVSVSKTESESEEPTDVAFHTAAVMAMRDALAGAAPALLEPIMELEIVTPEEHMGDVLADLNTRRGQVKHVDGDEDHRTITALVPLAELFGYATTLRSVSKGRASYTMQPIHFELVPDNIVKTVI